MNNAYRSLRPATAEPTRRHHHRKASLLNLARRPDSPSHEPVPKIRIDLVGGLMRRQKQVRSAVGAALKEVEKSKLLLSSSGEVLRRCGICWGDQGADFFPLRLCAHSFDSECLRRHLLNAAEEGRFPIRCPEADCHAEISLADASLLLSEAELEQLYQWSFKFYARTHAHELIGCATPDCPYLAYTDASTSDHFCCPLCAAQQCTKCRKPWHAGMTCQAAAINSKYSVQDKQFEQFLANLDYGHCPRCQVVVQQAPGCAAIKCNCGQIFCAVCHRPRNEHSLRDWRAHQSIRNAKLQQKANEDRQRQVQQDPHARWISAQRDRLDKQLKQQVKFIARPVPLYPAAPKTLTSFMSKGKLREPSKSRISEGERRMASTSAASFYRSTPCSPPPRASMIDARPLPRVALLNVRRGKSQQKRGKSQKRAKATGHSFLLREMPLL